MFSCCILLRILFLYVTIRSAQSAPFSVCAMKGKAHFLVMLGILAVLEFQYLQQKKLKIP